MILFAVAHVGRRHDGDAAGGFDLAGQLSLKSRGAERSSPPSRCAAARRLAKHQPMPLDAPVTTATRLTNLIVHHVP